MLGFVGDFGNGLLYFVARSWIGVDCRLPRHRRLRHQVPGLRRTAQRDRRDRRSPHRHREETMTLNFLSLHCGPRLLDLRVRRLRNHPAQQHPRDDPLWLLLLRLVHRGRSGGWLGHVAGQALASPRSNICAMLPRYCPCFGRSGLVALSLWGLNPDSLGLLKPATPSSSQPPSPPFRRRQEFTRIGESLRLAAHPTGLRGPSGALELNLPAGKPMIAALETMPMSHSRRDFLEDLDRARGIHNCRLRRQFVCWHAATAGSALGASLSRF